MLSLLSFLLERFTPCSFAQATNGYVYFGNGMTSLRKWRDTLSMAALAGVNTPNVGFTIAGSGSGTITGTYRAYTRFVDEDGNFSALSPVSNELVASNVLSIVATGVVTPPAGQRIVRRQILRNTSGQFQTFYVDIDSTDLATSTFSMSRSDNDLQTQGKVPLFDTLGSDIADRMSPPRNDKPIIAHHLGRLFLGGQVNASQGHVEVTNGSTTVQGVGTDFRAVFAGRVLYAGGGSYSISSVDLTNQRLTLATAYAGTTDKFATFIVRSAPAERNTVYWSEAGGNYDGWDPSSGVAVGDADDEVVGLMPFGSYLYILQRRATYRFTYNKDPATDGGVFLATRRGAVNNRVWAIDGPRTFLMDERGFYRFEDGQVTELSQSIQDLFFRDRRGLSINWKSARYFHASHDEHDNTVRWFVSLGGDRLPRNAIAYNYRTQAWWVEEFPFPVGASASSNTIPAFPILGGPNKRLYTFGSDSRDGIQGGGLNGKAASAGIASLEQRIAEAPAAAVGLPIAITAGRGKGQWRTIAAVSGTTLRVTRPWSIRPDSTSEYQIGAIPWSWTSRLFRWIEWESSNRRRVELLYQPTKNRAALDARLYLDRAKEPIRWDLTFPARGEGDAPVVRYEARGVDASVNLQNSAGHAAMQVDGSRERTSGYPGLVQLELRGFSGGDPVAVFQIRLDGVESVED